LYRVPLWLLFAGLSALLTACREEGNVVSELGVQIVTFPNGHSVRAEVMRTQDDLVRGMMYRDSLPAGRGMLFIHPKPVHSPYWMFRVRVPLDIIFMDSAQQIVHIQANAPPCNAPAKECPQYAPDPPRLVQYVLELPGGEAAKQGLQPGQRLRF
jgi:uncharacterized membrane protein (UPF0127 family)